VSSVSEVGDVFVIIAGARVLYHLKKVSSAVLLQVFEAVRAEQPSAH